MDEQTAIRLCLDQRDVRGFEFLFEKFRREAYVHAIALLGNREEAADACQDAFGKAFVAIRRLASLDAFYPWFYRILRNHCLNRIARRQTAAQYEERLAAETATTHPVEKPDFLLEAHEEQVQVWDALRRIKAEFREILVMKYIEGLNYDGIAQRLQIPRGTVMSRLYHARKAFAAQYAK
ncbi:MAG: RNA polymerase sigma factor [Gemmatimonadota bacterium]|nr:RNA polymerase sigma factor [Gemmatimonadota bacterium]